MKNLFFLYLPPPGIFFASALWIFLNACYWKIRVISDSMAVWGSELVPCMAVGHLQNGHSVQKQLFFETWHLSLIFLKVKWARNILMREFGQHQTGLDPNTDSVCRRVVQIMWAILSTDLVSHHIKKIPPI